MNAVNLLPPQYRSRRISLSASTPFMALAAGLLLVLLATFLLVSSENQVTSRRSQLAQLNVSAAHWSGLSERYNAFSTQVQQHTAEEADVSQLASTRFNWSQLLGQVAALMPSDAHLGSLQAASPLSSSTTGVASGSTGSSIQVSGCAASQDAVAQAMVQLHRITGIKSVTLSSSTDSSAGVSSGPSGSSSGSTTGCGLPVQFGLTLAFASSAGASGTASVSGTGSALSSTTNASSSPTTPASDTSSAQ